MTRTIFSRVMWVGKRLCFLWAWWWILALLVGFASAALAGTGRGAVFNLGKTNSVNATSTLKGRGQRSHAQDNEQRRGHGTQPAGAI